MSDKDPVDPANAGVLDGSIRDSDIDVEGLYENAEMSDEDPVDPDNAHGNCVNQALVVIDVKDNPRTDQEDNSGAVSGKNIPYFL